MNARGESARAALESAAARMRAAGLPDGLALTMERLAGQLDEPCVIAVVGRVKAGKSTFVNALLGADHAKVGTTETTATINRFRYGQPTNPALPVRCHWRNGAVTDESQAFLDGLQGTDVEVLRRADGIRYLEYVCPSPILRNAILVDTPGTGAVIDEHQDRTAEYLQLSAQLRHRHDEETQQLGREADAVVYLVGPAARATDAAFLDELRQATEGGARAFNAVGVLAKVDIHPDLFARASELASRVSAQLCDTLNTVVPVSSALQRIVDALRGRPPEEIADLVAAVRRIPPDDQDLLLSMEQLFEELETDECPVSATDRAALRCAVGGPWMAFAAFAQTAADRTLSSSGVLDRLESLAGFRELRRVMESHLFARGHILRQSRVLADAQKVVNRIGFREIPALEGRSAQDRGRLDRLLAFIRAAPGDRAVAADLEELVRGSLDSARLVGPLEALYQDLDLTLAELQRDLSDDNADFEALQQLLDNPHLFTDAERDELRALLGMYGVEPDKRLPPEAASASCVRARQLAWRDAVMLSRSGARKTVAERAEQRYADLLFRLTRQC